MRAATAVTECDFRSAMRNEHTIFKYYQYNCITQLDDAT